MILALASISRACKYDKIQADSSKATESDVATVFANEFLVFRLDFADEPLQTRSHIHHCSRVL